MVAASLLVLFAVTPDPLREEARGLGELIVMQRRLADAELDVGRALREEASLRDHLTRARGLLAEREESLARTRGWLRARLRARERSKRTGVLSILFASRDLADYRRRRRVLARSVERDLTRLRAFVAE